MRCIISIQRLIDQILVAVRRTAVDQFADEPREEELDAQNDGQDGQVEERLVGNRSQREGVSLLPEMLPSIVLVFGIMLFWNAIYKIIPLYNTIWIMVLAYVVDEVKDKMIAGEAAVALVWSGDATFCMSENDELDYMIPPEGSNIFYDSICIPANARNVSGAEKFIDFLCRGDIAAMNYDYVGYAIPNTAAIDIIGADEYNASPVNNPPQEALDHCQVFKYLGDDTKLYDQIWTEIISEF